jgi:glycerol uptake facilitator-like aquaporin
MNFLFPATYVEMLHYIVEFLGTFLFLSVIVATGQPILIALTLLVCIMLAGGISGAHFNPAVSLVFFAKGDMPIAKLGGYVLAQSLGGLAALGVFKALSG